MDTSTIDSNKYADWLKDEIDLYLTYHNHKETMAWTATAFYLPAILGLAYGAYSIQPRLLGSVGFTVLACVMAQVALFFVNMQFRMRWEADDISNGLRGALTRLCAGNPPLTPVEKLEKSGGEYPWPWFVEDEIKRAKDKNAGDVKENWKKVDTKKRGEFCMECRMFWEGVLSLSRLRLKKIDDRYKTELASYMAIIIISLIAVAVVWVHYLDP